MTLMASCASWSKMYLPLKAFKGGTVLKKHYEEGRPIFIQDYVFQYHRGFWLGDEWDARWLSADTAFESFRRALEPLSLQHDFRFSFVNRNMQTSVFAKSAEYNPKLIDQAEIVRHARAPAGQLVLFPLLSYVMFTGNHQYHDFQIQDPMMEYHYVIFLHVYLIEDDEIIYHQARRLKGFTLWPEDIEFEQEYWDLLLRDALIPYFQRLGPKRH